MATVQKKTVLITGCGPKGIGSAMAKHFCAQNYYVFATTRNLSTSTDSSLASLPDIEMLELDVTLPHTIARCKDIVAKRTGGKLDVLVNNAGVEFNSPLLDTDIAEAKRLFDVNVWGLLEMVQAFAPLLVEAGGMVFNQSSIDAELSMVWAEILRIELEPLGVRVVTSICGSVNTPMFTKPGGPMQLPETSYYRGVQDKAWQERMDHQRQATDVDVLAEKLVRDIVRGAKGVVWHGAFAPSVKWAGWLNILWVLNIMINSARGLGQIKR
ncbi:hypothetical protein yc1106_09506 [Curvularia clavata]|uniref:NAD(P)-binding protein n=1 Tax=Curvularia clavata TaxID=95742 RepID=A0A9Q8ZHU2_CURCL|nr:hypothetical protein yc1106_09506 [Curvularia clavata]